MRLTKKNGEDYVVDNYISLNEPWKSSINKLGQLEDIEEKLGIPLDLFVKAITSNVYIKGKEPEWAGVGTKKDIQKYRVLSFTVDELIVRFGGSDYDTHVIKRPLSKLGKTWALTKEELL